MSSPRDPETKRVAKDKVDEGMRLLAAGDYEGAIAACAEAIELEPMIRDAHRTLAEAYRLLAGCGKRARRTDVVGRASSSPTISVIS